MESTNKEVLDYTEDELRELPVEELQGLLKEAESKESLFNTEQLVSKVLINSLYGALGNKYFPLFNQDIARAITGNGRYFIHKLANKIEEKLQGLFSQDKKYIIYGDTDSIYFSIEPFMKIVQDKPIQEQTDIADAFEKKIIQPVISETIQEFSSELNAYNPEVIGAEREIISDKSIFVSKKKYIARVLDSEGVRYTEPKTKVMGLELIKSSTPVFSRKKLKESIDIMLDSSKDEMQEWISTVRDEFMNIPLGEIATTSGVSSLDYELGDKGIPIGSRTSIIHNKYIDANNLGDRFNKIAHGDKTKRLYLVQPNPLNTEVVAFLDDRFIEMFHDYIDWDTNFEKGFLKPLEIMTTALKWDLRNTMEELEEW